MLTSKFITSNTTNSMILQRIRKNTSIAIIKIYRFISYYSIYSIVRIRIVNIEYVYYSYQWRL